MQLNHWPTLAICNRCVGGSMSGPLARTRRAPRTTRAIIRTTHTHDIHLDLTVRSVSFDPRARPSHRSFGTLELGMKASHLDSAREVTTKGMLLLRPLNTWQARISGLLGEIWIRVLPCKVLWGQRQRWYWRSCVQLLELGPWARARAWWPVDRQGYLRGGSVLRLWPWGPPLGPTVGPTLRPPTDRLGRPHTLKI